MAKEQYEVKVADKDTLIYDTLTEGDTIYDISTGATYRMGGVKIVPPFSLAGSGLTVSDSSVEVITEWIIRTVGVGKDFDTLHQAMKWIETVSTTADGYIELKLDDGLHLIGEPDTFNFDYWGYYLFSASMKIMSASGDKTLCTIAMPSTDDGDNWPAIFLSVSGGTITLDKVTIDMAADGYPYASNTYLGWSWGYHFSTAVINNCTVKNLSVGFGYTNVSTVSTDYKDISSFCLDVNYIHCKGTYDANCTFTNAPIADMPTNEIQYNGSFVTNETSPLTLKA